ncbi:MAG: M20/M25/M40 family metallo-hydrolase [Armatimonadetes bacterium]|nr:M20/M25/M40 family metallo-hydrolase [Armatimonadota bacterium]
MVNESRLLGMFLRFLEINSPPRKEKAVAEAICAEIEGMGLAPLRDQAGEQVGGETDNIIVNIPGRAEGAPRLLFSAHFDTVAPTEGLRIVREGGVIRTESATILGADDKSGVAAILEGIRAVREEGVPHGPIDAVFSICEEVGLLGAKCLDYSLIRPDMGFVLDAGKPVGGVVATAPSHNLITAVVTGKPAHAGVCPEEGVDALQAAARAIARMRLGRIDPETTANMGIARGGEARNIVPARVEVQGEARSRNEGKLEEISRHIVEAFESAAAEAGASAEIKIDRSYNTYRHLPTAPVVGLALQAARDIGAPQDLFAAGGGSDANIFNARGIPTVVVGTGMEKVHTHDEHIAVSDLVKAAEFVASAIRRAAAAP